MRRLLTSAIYRDRENALIKVPRVCVLEVALLFVLLILFFLIIVLILMLDIVLCRLVEVGFDLLI